MWRGGVPDAQAERASLTRLCLCACVCSFGGRTLLPFARVASLRQHQKGFVKLGSSAGGLSVLRWVLFFGLFVGARHVSRAVWICCWSILQCHTVLLHYCSSWGAVSAVSAMSLCGLPSVTKPKPTTWFSALHAKHERRVTHLGQADTQEGRWPP